MKASEHNIETLMISIHQIIEEYSDSLAAALNDGTAPQHTIYPPNNGFEESELDVLKLLESNSELKSALRKLIASSMAGTFFDFFNLIDGTSDPSPNLGKWTELGLVDKTNQYEPNTDMLHDILFESYWSWKKLRPTKGWKLDNYEGE